MIVIGGMIGLGKTTTAKTLHEALHLPVYYESVKDNKVLPLFYRADRKEMEEKRYPFLLQLNFLSSRFVSLTKAKVDKDAVLDRSIYEDFYFCKKNHDLGRISDLEMEVYTSLFDSMVDSLKEEKPFMVYLKGSFETVLSRIRERGRDFELDESLVEYYRYLWKEYDSCIFSAYPKDRLLVIDVDRFDINKNSSDREWFLKAVDSLMNEKN